MLKKHASGPWKNLRVLINNKLVRKAFHFTYSMTHNLILHQFAGCLLVLFSKILGTTWNLPPYWILSWSLEIKLKPWHMRARVPQQSHTLPSKPMNNSKVDKMALLTIGTSDWHLLIFPLPPLGTAICWSCFHTWYDFTFLRKLEPCRRNPASVPTLLHLALCQGSPMSSYKCTVSVIKGWLISQAVHTTFSSAAPPWIDI